MSLELTLMAGMLSETGTERARVGPCAASSCLAVSPAQGSGTDEAALPDEPLDPDPDAVPVEPAAERAGCGA